MARPAGHRLHRQAWDDVLRLTGVTLTQVADRSGIPRATVSSLYGGHHKASVKVASQLADAVDCHPQTIFPTLSTWLTEAAADTEEVA